MGKVSSYSYDSATAQALRGLTGLGDPVEVTGSRAMEAGDVGKLILVTTGESDATYTTLPASEWTGVVYIAKADNSAINITGAADNGSTLIRLNHDAASFASGQIILVPGAPESNLVGCLRAMGHWYATPVDATHTDLPTSFFDSGNPWVSGGVIKSGFLNISDGSAVIATLFRGPTSAKEDGDIVAIRSDGTNVYVLSHQIAPWRFYRTAPVTAESFAVPPLVRAIRYRLQGAGAGAGSGRRGATSSARGGAPGANAGLRLNGWLKRDDFGATLSLTVGTGGSGAAGVTADNTDGSAGTFGSSSELVNLCLANISTAGLKGSSAQGTPVSQAGSTSEGFDNSGAANNLTGTPSPGKTTGAGPGSGGAGGSLSTGNVEEAPSSGGNGNQIGYGSSGLRSTGGAAPSAGSGSNGPNGADAISLDSTGGGGAGGATHGSSAGANGGNGGRPGGGAGGGAASLNGAASGAGGNGGDGQVMLELWF